MTDLLRTYFGRHYFSDNPAGWLSVPATLLFVAIVIFGPVPWMHHAHPGQVWRDSGLRMFMFFAAMYAAQGVSLQYWRLIGSKSAALVPGFQDRHRRLYLGVQCMLSLLVAAVLLRSGDAWSGALALGTAIVVFSMGGGPRFETRRPRWQMSAMRFAFIPMMVLFIMDGATVWRMVGDLHPAAALALVAFLLGVLYVGSGFNPALASLSRERREAAVDLRPARRGPGLRRLLQWRPPGGSRPIMFSPAQMSAAGFAVVILVVFGLQYALTIVGAMVLHLTPAALHRVMQMLVLQLAIALAMFAGISQGAWLSRRAEWHSIYLTGVWGGREQFCRSAYRQHLREALQNAVVCALLVALFAQIELSLPTAVAVSVGLWVMLVIVLMSYVNSIALALRLQSPAIDSVIQTLMYSVVGLGGLYWILLRTLSSGQSMNVEQSIAFALLGATAHFIHRRAPSGLMHQDWAK